MMKPIFLALAFAVAVGVAARSGTSAAPAPPDPPPGPLEGKYTLVLSSTARPLPAGAPAAFAAKGAFTSSVKRPTTITRNTIEIDGQTATWEYKLDTKAKPMAIDLTITPIRGAATKAQGIVEFQGNRLLLAYRTDGGERPKDIENADGVFIYVFQKAPPPPRTEYKIVVLQVGKEAEAERSLNRLAKEGYEVSHSTSPATPAQPGAQPVIHIILKRTAQ